jgi:hypothetical protein
MNYNHIAYGQQKVISPKKTEATATGIDGDFITREFLSVGIVILHFIAQGIRLMQGMECLIIYMLYAPTFKVTRRVNE